MVVVLVAAVELVVVVDGSVEMKLSKRIMQT